MPDPSQCTVKKQKIQEVVMSKNEVVVYGLELSSQNRQPMSTVNVAPLSVL
jgi:hypothetical protein